MKLRVQDILELKNISYRIIELWDRAISVEDVIAYSKEPINPKEICKTILVKHKKQYYALFLRGSDKIDFSKLKGLIGKASIASMAEVKEITGVDAGAVCPLLLDIPVIVDKRVLKLERLNFGSSDHHHGVEIASSDLGKVLEHSVANIAG